MCANEHLNKRKNMYIYIEVGSAMSTTFLCIVFCQTNNITDSNVMTFLGFPWLYLFEAVQDHSLCATCRSGSSPMVSHPGQDRSQDGKIGTPAVLSCKKSSASSRSLTELDQDSFWKGTPELDSTCKWFPPVFFLNARLFRIW